jgi:hypothetical protein
MRHLSSALDFKLCILAVLIFIAGCTTKKNADGQRTSELRSHSIDSDMLAIADGRNRLRVGRAVSHNRTGWIMRSANGVPFSKSELIAESERYIVPHGRQAVPSLIRWLSNEQMHVRFVAAHALRRITGLDPAFYYFGTPGYEYNGSKDWFDNACSSWMAWYIDQESSSTN